MSATARQARSSWHRRCRRRFSPCKPGPTRNITAEDNEAFERALTDAGVAHELVVYDGAPHSFFDRKHEEFAGDSEDAWNRVLAFLERHAR